MSQDRQTIMRMHGLMNAVLERAMRQLAGVACVLLTLLLPGNATAMAHDIETRTATVNDIALHYL
jgi:hypothetical protein